MPRQDASGRWISDDGRFWWDGAAWQPIVATPQPAMAYGYAPAQPSQGRSPWPGILIGCGIAAAILLVLGILGTILMVNSPDFQRGFCSGYTRNDPNAVCPFHPSP